MDFEILYILCIFIGILSGMASGIFGLGGGIIIVPALLSFGLSSHVAVAMSALQMIFASSFGSYINYKKKNLDIRDGIFVGLGGLFGASFSGELIKLLSDTSLNALFLCVNIIFFIKFIFSFKTEARKSQRSENFKKFILFCAGAITGLFAISLGIGGGLLITPILAYFLGYDTKKTVCISLFFIIFASLAGSFSFFRQGYIDEDILVSGVLIGLSSMLGVFLGIKLMEKMQLKSHRKALVFVYIASICMTANALLKKLELY